MHHCRLWMRAGVAGALGQVGSQWINPVSSERDQGRGSPSAKPWHTHWCSIHWAQGFDERMTLAFFFFYQSVLTAGVSKVRQLLWQDWTQLDLHWEEQGSRKGGWMDWWLFVSTDCIKKYEKPNEGYCNALKGYVVLLWVMNGTNTFQQQAQGCMSMCRLC